MRQCPSCNSPIWLPSSDSPFSMSEETFLRANADTILPFQITQLTDAGADIILQVVDLPVDIIALHNNRVQVHDHGLRVQHLLQLDLERTQRLRSRLAEIANCIHLLTQRKPPNHWRVEVKSVGLPHFLRIVVLARRKEEGNLVLDDTCRADSASAATRCLCN